MTALILLPVNLVPQCYMVSETIELNMELPKKKKNVLTVLKEEVNTDSIVSEGEAVVSHCVLSPIILSTLQLLPALFFDLFLIKFVRKKSPKRKSHSLSPPALFPTQVIDHNDFMVT